MFGFNKIADLISLAEEKQMPLHAFVIAYEMDMSRKPRWEIMQGMLHNWRVMREAIEKGLQNKSRSLSGLTGGDAVKLRQYKDSYLGDTALRAATCAIGTAEINACMGRIVACPTAGSCGIVPAALYAAAEKMHLYEENVVNALFTAAGIGMVIEQNACIAGALGGCQAECGAAAGMAAGALVELAGGTPRQIGHGVALAIKNMLGLACDPVAGLVEVPCVKRNGFATVHAMLAADMALAGVESVIPVDEVIAAMDSIGKSLPESIRETGDGGLAVTETGKALREKIFGTN